jgi:hypothetical protein
MRSTFLLVLGLVAAYPSTVASAQSVTLREECTRDRCVYYKGSTRKFSVEREYGTKRLVIRNAKRQVVAKVRRQGNASVRVEKPYR